MGLPPSLTIGGALANPVRRSDSLSDVLHPPPGKSIAASRVQAARTRSATVNFPPPNGFPKAVMGELKEKLSARGPAQEEKTKEPAPRVARAASFSLNSDPKKNAYWEDVYGRSYFKNEKEFAQVVKYVNDKLKNEKLEHSTKGIFTLIKNAGYLANADNSKNINDAVRACLNTRTIEVTMSGTGLKKALEALDVALQAIEKEFSSLNV